MPRLFFARSLLSLGLLLAGAAHGTDAPPPALYPFAIDENALGGAPDQSALNAPLDAQARLSARNGHFYRAGPDGRWNTDDDERVRLFGINLSFGANFPRAEEAPRLARRLRKLGFNAVRLHHLDTSPGTSTDAPASLLTPGPYPTFNEAAVERLRNLIRAFSREGIYVNLNLHVGYRFRPDADAVPAYEADRMKRPIASPIVVYHPRMVALQEKFAEEAIGRLGLRDNPALGMVEINNESSLLAAWQRNEWRDAVPAAYRDILLEAWRDWVSRQYGSAQAACAAWQDCTNRAGPLELPSPADAQRTSTAFDALFQKVERRARALISDPAPAPAVKPPARRILDFVQFLAEQDRRYLDRMRQAVRRSAGFDVPVTGTQVGYGGLLNLTSHEGMDYLDDHFYVDHPDFVQGSGNIRNWRIWNVSLTGKHMDMLRLSSFRRQAGKPFVVSEFNHPFPSGPAGEIVPLVAAYASLQDWDGLFFFDYGENPSGSQAPSNFGLSGDWGKFVNVGQSARLFRENWLPSPAASLTLPMPVALQALLTARGLAPDGTDRTDGYLAGLYGLSTADIWQRRIAVSPGLTSLLATAPDNAAPLPRTTIPNARCSRSAPPPAGLLRPDGRTERRSGRPAGRPRATGIRLCRCRHAQHPGQRGGRLRTRVVADLGHRHGRNPAGLHTGSPQGAGSPPQRLGLMDAGTRPAVPRLRVGITQCPAACVACRPSHAGQLAVEGQPDRDIPAGRRRPAHPCTATRACPRRGRTGDRRPAIHSR